MSQSAYTNLFNRSEIFFNGYDGTKLFLQKWIKPEAKGTILITHGQAEHSDCYHRLIQAFENEAWNFIAWDMRGHGRSAGLRGYAKDIDDYVLDFQIFLELCKNLPEVKDHPVVVLGHSMGALVQECSLIDKKTSGLTAQILSSPLFGFAIEVPVWKDTGSYFINQFLPQLTLGNEIKNSDLTRDPEVIREFEQDTYRHGKISAGVYIGMKREMLKVTSRAAEITLPTLLHIADDDPIVSSPVALQFFETILSEKKHLKIVEGGRHELYNDTARGEVFKTVIDFLKPYLEKVD